MLISQRPAQAADRAVPGHWEGGLIIGKNNGSAIGALVERSSRCVMLVHLPASHDAICVHDALITTINTLPAHLRRSVTWDQEAEMTLHQQFSWPPTCPSTSATHTPPGNAAPTTTPTACFPKDTDPAHHPHGHLNTVTAELNSRPRKTLG